MGQPLGLGHVLAPIGPSHLKDLRQDARAAISKALQLVGIQEVTHHYEAVAVEDPRCAVDLIRRADLESADSVAVAQVLAQLLHLWVVVGTTAGRAGIRPGHRIVAIGGRAVRDMDDHQAASALSMAAERRQDLSIVRTSGREGQEGMDHKPLDRGYVWLTM